MADSFEPDSFEADAVKKPPASQGVLGRVQSFLYNPTRETTPEQRQQELGKFQEAPFGSKTPQIESGINIAGMVAAPLEMGTEALLGTNLGKVLPGMIKGAFKEGFAPGKYFGHAIPQAATGAIGGGILGNEFGHRELGAAIGGVTPFIRGAIKGARAALPSGPEVGQLVKAFPKAETLEETEKIGSTAIPGPVEPFKRNPNIARKYAQSKAKGPVGPTLTRGKGTRVSGTIREDIESPKEFLKSKSEEVTPEELKTSNPEPLGKVGPVSKAEKVKDISQQLNEELGKSSEKDPFKESLIDDLTGKTKREPLTEEKKLSLHQELRTPKVMRAVNKLETPEGLGSYSIQELRSMSDDAFNDALKSIGEQPSKSTGAEKGLTKDQYITEVIKRREKKVGPFGSERGSFPIGGPKRLNLKDLEKEFNTREPQTVAPEGNINKLIKVWSKDGKVKAVYQIPNETTIGDKITEGISEKDLDYLWKQHPDAHGFEILNDTPEVREYLRTRGTWELPKVEPFSP